MSEPNTSNRPETPHSSRSDILATVLSALACLLLFAIIIIACPALAEPAEGTIQGRVVNQHDGSPIEGVEVVILANGASARTDSHGRFVLSGQRAGTFTLEARRPGYAPQTIEGVSVNGLETTSIEIELRPVRFLSEVVVTPSRYTLFAEQPEVRTSLSREAVNRMPHFADDTFRALERLPGATGEEVSAQMNIRGGEVNEVQVLLDGLEIYDGFHLKDMFSVFSIVDSEAIGGLDVMTGGFPIEHGNRMSGVIDISSSTPQEPGRTAVGLSFTNFGFLSEGLFADGRGQWLVSARRTYLDMVLEWIDPDNNFKPLFYDVLGSVRYQLGEHTWLSANVLGVYDDLGYEEYSDDGTFLEEDLDASTSGGYTWLNLRTSWTPRLFSQTVLSYGQVEHEREGWVEYWTVEGDVDDTRSFDVAGLKQDWTLELGDRHLFKWGLDLRSLDAEYDYARWSIVRDPLWTGGPPVVTERDIHLSPSGNQYGVYLGDRIRLAEALVAELGVRWDEQTWAGDDQLSPRLNLAWMVGDRTTVRAAWGLYHQPSYIHELQVEDGVTCFAPAQLAEHVLLGVERGLAKGYHLRVEAYHKDLEDLRPRYENQLNPIEIFPEIEPDRIMVAPERAEANGIEVVLKRNNGRRWTWWLSYAWSEAEDLIDGEWVPRSWDQTHTANFSLNYHRGRKWNFNLSGIYHTGWPTTAIEAEVYVNPDGTRWVSAALGPRNGERYHDYLRLDLRASRDFHFSSGSARLFIEVVNLLNRENLQRLEDVDYYVDPDGNLHVSEDWESYFPMIPTFGIRWTF